MATGRRRTQLSAAEARRIALAAQGLADPKPVGRIDRRHLHRLVARVGAIQLDSVNVLVRSHYLPLYSRVGGYDRELLDRTAYQHRELFEYWGHAASLLPVELQPLFRWRMDEADAWEGMKRIAREHPGYVETVLREVADRGPIAAGELSEPGARGESWGWGWSMGKQALEWLFYTGRLAAQRRGNFQRVYDLPERVLPPEVLSAPTPPKDEAHRSLLGLAARALGVATARDLAFYFRLTIPEVRPRIAELIEEGNLSPVSVEGWEQPAYLVAGARLPRVVEARTLLTPFDSLLWERERNERLFGFHYRIGIYTPKAKRVHGYYVLPFLLGDELVGRVDLKSDRKNGTLLVQSAHSESGARATKLADGLRAELTALAAWLGLDRVAAPRGAGGDLPKALRLDVL
jgi:uncharacterized protein YcaQ